MFNCAFPSSSSICEGSVGDNKGGSPCRLVFSVLDWLGVTRGASGAVRAFFAGGETGPRLESLDSFASEIASIDLLCFS